MTISSIRDLRPGDKVAIKDQNIHGEFFYIEAEVLDISPKGYLITTEGTFDLNKTASLKKPVLIDEYIEEEILKLRLRKYIHNHILPKLSEFSLIELMTISDIVKDYYA